MQDLLVLIRVCCRSKWKCRCTFLHSLTRSGRDRYAILLEIQPGEAGLGLIVALLNCNGRREQDRFSIFFQLLGREHKRSIFIRNYGLPPLLLRAVVGRSRIYSVIAILDWIPIYPI